MIEGVNVLEQIPIKDYTTLSGVFLCVGIAAMVISLLLLVLVVAPSSGDCRIDFKKISAKIFLFLYIGGIAVSLFSIVHFPWFYKETGKYMYRATFEDCVSINDIGDNFDIVGIDGEVWTIKDK